ncbi:MAG TPA: SDR family NAD(P)-dependent oxidoreductase [Nitrospiria bacterium]
MSGLSGRVAVVTGGGSGIGLDVARTLAEEGVHVTICGRKKGKLESAVRKFKKLPGEVRSVVADVSRPADVRRLMAGVIRRHRRVDVLVNNAGIYKRGNLDSISLADWDEIINVNLRGAFLCTRAVLPVMKKRRSGYVINISSLAGKMGMEGGGAYSASKFGLNGMTESLAEEGERFNIRATSICPGYVATPMVRGVAVPFKKMIQPGDISQTVLYLLNLTPQVKIKEIVIERKGAG